MPQSDNTEKQDIEKLENLILAILQDNPMCRIKINALVFEADKQAFLTLGHKITGSTYIRKWNGPTISNLDEILDRMCREKKIELSKDCEHCEYQPLCSKFAQSYH